MITTIFLLMLFTTITFCMAGSILVIVLFAIKKDNSVDIAEPVQQVINCAQAAPTSQPEDEHSLYMKKLNELFATNNSTENDVCVVSGYACRDGEYEERAEEISYDDDDECYIPYHLRCDDEEENNDNVFTAAASFLGVDNDDGVDNAFTAVAEFFGAYDDVWF